MNNQTHPPKHALSFLRWFCREDYLEEVEGNLMELFDVEAENSVKQANWGFLKNVLLHFRPEYIRPMEGTYRLNYYGMFKNFVKVGIRNIARDKAYTAINILGLALGILCCFFILLWVSDERSMDNFHENGEELYHVYHTWTVEGETSGDYNTQIKRVDNKWTVPIKGITQAIPEVKHVGLYATGYELPWGHPETFQLGDKIFKLKGSRATNDFLKMYSYPIIAGDASTPLVDVSSIAISEKMAGMFFDSPEEAVGKSIRYEGTREFTITAVFENVPSHSTFQFEFLINWEANMTVLSQASNFISTTVQLKKGADAEKVAGSIDAFMASQIELDEGVERTAGLQPFKNKYLYGTFENGHPVKGRIEYINIFLLVALFVLVIACINFTNLSTARSFRRAREVGVRKVIGSSKSYLVGQFLLESIFLATISTLLALGILIFLLPYFNSFTGKDIALPYADLSVWGIIGGIVLLIGFLAGSYPSLFLASLKPVSVLKGNLQFARSENWIRKGLTIFQFSLSILLLIATLVVARQTDFIQQSHLGYDKENLVYVRVEGELMDLNKYYLFKQKAMNAPGIAMVDKSSEAPHTMRFVISDPINWEGKREDDAVGFKPSSVGFDFIDLMKLEIVEGRAFSREYATDSSDAFIVNEEAVRQMGMENPIGKWISAWTKKGQIIGVLKDYHTQSFHEPIKPLVIDIKEWQAFGVILIRTEAGMTKEALSSLEEIYKEINPSIAFDYQFIDQEYQALYASEQTISKLANSFAILAIIISCLGLLGLAMYSAQRRLKEFGIRKILGASVQHIMAIFSKEFVLLVGFSFLLAAPISWMLMDNWLQGFA